jgi:tetratricopeptide (TPR) repeat protein
LLRRAATSLVEEKRRPAVVALAWQCRQLGDAPLADHLLTLALDRPEDSERLAVTLTALAYLWQADQLARADDLLQGLLAREPFSREPELWRLASALTERRGLTARSIACLERALDLEYQDLPAVIDLQAWRHDYGKLLDHYQALASALAPLRAPAPSDLAGRVVRAADRWRAHDPETGRACQVAARTLRALGARDPAWEYLTTSLGSRASEPSAWLDLARTLSREGDPDLADCAYAAASEADPANALLLWERAQNLRQAGRAEQAEHLLRRLAGAKWPTPSQGISTRVRREFEGY